jgi:hypothetical protein
VPSVPDRLEQAVGEPERQDVVDGLLAEEMVDPEDLRLVEDGGDGLVQCASGAQVGPERFLDDDPDPGARPASPSMVTVGSNAVGGTARWTAAPVCRRCPVPPA